MGFETLPKPPALNVDQGMDEDEQQHSACRVCWQAESEANLLSPCLCSGTQKHVHLKCLRRWQEHVQKRDASDERAFRCSVCRALFSVPPPQPRSAALAAQALRGIGGALCITLLAFGLSGPPWPHLALLVLLLLASRSHWLPGMALLLVCGGLAAMHARGLRLVLRLDGGGRVGLALIRRGAPVPGIRPGVLLVAAEGLDHSMFRRSVVLLTQHGREGARGVILTQPMATPPATGHALAGGAAGGGERGSARRGGGGQEGGAVLRHFLGGPVGMPGEGVNHEVVVLHSLEGVAGARRILPPANDSAAPQQPRDAGRHPPALPLFEGGSLAEVLERAAEADAAAAAAASQAGAAVSRAAARRGGRRGAAQGAGGMAAEAASPVLLFHGVCAWAEGQLEGELRAGAWGFTTDQAAGGLPLLSLPPDQLWQALAGSPSLARLV